MSFVLYGMRIALLGFAAFALPFLAQSPSGPSLTVFGVPLGATAVDVERMAAQRGITGPTLAGDCRTGRICSYRVNIENLPGTEFVSTMWGNRRLPDRMESFSFAFTAPPNAPRIWSAGSDQTFGDRYTPSPAAPLLNDVLAELRQRFGEPARMFAAGGGEISRNLPVGQIYWIWDAQGRPVPWTKVSRQTCYLAISQAMVETGNTVRASWNAAPVNPRPFVLARQGNCARVVRAEIGHARGLVYSLSVRMADFQAGHDAQFRTNQLLREKGGEADTARSARNRPDF